MFNNNSNNNNNNQDKVSSRRILARGPVKASSAAINKIHNKSSRWMVYISEAG
jgi:hypothetical protein